MNRLSQIALASLTVALAACQASDDTPANEATPEPVVPEVLGNASLALADGTAAGNAELLGDGDTVSITIALSGLPEGVHGVHLHMTGSCEASDFTSAGGHLNPGDKQHGTENPMGSHLGDLPNAVVDANGIGTVTATLTGSREEVLASIFDEDGTAVVVHEGEDDYKTDPAGDAGSRIACGVIEPSAVPPAT